MALKRSTCCLLVLLFVTIRSNAQIYESTLIEDQRNIQYDTLGVETVKEYALGWKWKFKYLETVKKYDSDGFLVEVTFYEMVGRNRSKPKMTKIYEYNSDRTEVIETWLVRAKWKVDTNFISRQRYNEQGLILSISEKHVEAGTRRTIEYSYDDHGNCESITRKAPLSVTYTEYYQNTYDSIGRIIEQVKVLRMGGTSEQSRAFNDSGQVLYDSIGNGNRVERFSYNLDGLLVRKDYQLDSTFYTNDFYQLTTCIIGSEHYTYDTEGRLISVNYDCDYFVNKENSMNIKVLGKKFYYDDLGLLINAAPVYNISLGKRPNKRSGRIYTYKRSREKQ